LLKRPFNRPIEWLPKAAQELALKDSDKKSEALADRLLSDNITTLDQLKIRPANEFPLKTTESPLK